MSYFAGFFAIEHDGYLHSSWINFIFANKCAIFLLFSCSSETYPYRTTSSPFPHKGLLIISGLPVNNTYQLKNMQVWSEPPDYAFVCFEPSVSSEDTFDRPATYWRLRSVRRRKLWWSSELNHMHQ